MFSASEKTASSNTSALPSFPGGGFEKAFLLGSRAFSSASSYPRMDTEREDKRRRRTTSADNVE